MGLSSDILLVMIVLLLFGGYLAASFIFLRYPTLLHRKKNVKFRAKHISHRGGAAEKIENTMEAFKNAERVGTDMLELDCQLTRDKKVVVSHDNVLTRTCGVDVRISETDYCELPKMKEKVCVDFFQALEGQGEDHQIPLLEDVFRNFPSMPINIDIKVNNDILIEKVNSLVREYKREDLTAWGNRSHLVCSKLYNNNPNVALIFSLRQALLVVVLYWTGLLPFVPLRESMYEVLMPGLLLDADVLFHRSYGRMAKLFIWFVDKLMMHPGFFEHLHRRGIQTNLWVLNREEDFARAFDLGVVGVMTDQVSLLREFLDQQPSLQEKAGKGDRAKCL